MRPDSYRISYALACGVMIVLAMLGAAQVAHDALGLTSQQLALMGVFSAGLGVAQGVLPRVTKPPASNRAGKD